MLAAQLTGVRSIAVTEIGDAHLTGPGQVRVRVKAVGICGSDVHNYVEGGTGGRKLSYPFIPGHEAAGMIVDVADDVTTVMPGDRVMIEPAMHCGQCDQCAIGRFNTCRNIQFLSSAGELQGCMREEIVVPAGNCFRIPDGVSYEEAAVAEPLSIAIHSIRLSVSMSPEIPVLILGAGPVGLCTLIAARQAGAEHVYVTDPIAERQAMALNYGACFAGTPDDDSLNTRLLAAEPLGFPVVFECCGKQDALDQAISLLRPGGKLMITGIPEKSHVSFCIDILRRHELTIANVRRQNQCVPAAIRMIADHQVDVQPIITHRFALAKAADAFEMVAGYADGVIKAMVVTDDS